MATTRPTRSATAGACTADTRDLERPAPAAPCTKRRISSPAVVGRRRELEVVADLLGEARRGVPSLCVIAGEAGVGKTRLTRELERLAREAGMICARGQCLALEGGEFPFAPLVGVFRELAARIGPEAISGLEPGARRFVDVLLGAPASDPGDLAAGERPGGRIGPTHAKASMLDALRRVAAEQPIAIVIEDVHWADDSTRDFIRYLARHLEHDRILIAATFRSDELPPDHGVRTLLAEMIRSEPVLWLELSRLTREDTAAQLEGIAGRPVTEDELEAIHARAQGNPFLAEELWTLRGTDGAAGIPTTLGDALLGRVRTLPMQVQEVLNLIAVFGRAVGEEVVVGATGDPGQTVGALRRAVGDHILVPSPGGRLTFRHALVREALYAQLMPGERQALHRAVVEAVERSAGAATAAELAYHHLAAGQRAAALAALIEAGLEDARLYAYPEASRHFERALELWDEIAPEDGLPLDRFDLLREAAEAARLIGEYDRAIALCRQALAEIDVVADPIRAAGFFERLSRYESWDVERSVEALDTALALLGREPSKERARLMTSQALALSLQGRWGDARGRAEEALADAIEVRAPLEECSARTELGLALAFVGDAEGGERCLRRALAVAEGLAAPEELARVYVNLAELERVRGRSGVALGAMREGQAAAMRLGAAASWGAFMAVVSADDLLQLGRWDELEELLGATEHLNAGRPGAVMWPLVAAQLAMAHGELDRALLLLERSWESAMRGVTPELLPHVGAALAELRLWRGEPRLAQRHIEDTRRLLGRHQDPLNTPPLLCTGVRVEAELAAVAGRAGDRAERQTALERAQDLTDRLDALIVTASAARPPATAAAWARQAHAELASVRRLEAAAREWSDAAACWDALAHPYRAAHARFRHAETLLSSRGRKGPGSQALRRSHEAADRLGARLLRREIEALARRARVALESAPPAHGAARARDEAFGLTRRETEVLRLVADGMTNRQIGERLFITPKTAGLHVSHILAKLNVDSRLKAAAVAHRSRLFGLTPAGTSQPG